nr:MAG TPA: hypothetical protein [Caudoviricetes sp.]
MAILTSFQTKKSQVPLLVILFYIVKKGFLCYLKTRKQKSPDIKLRLKIIGGRISTVVLIITHASIARYYYI